MKSKKLPVAEPGAITENQDAPIATTEPKRHKRTKKATLELVREPQPDAAQEPDGATTAAEPSTHPTVDPEQPKRAKGRKAKPSAMTLATLAEKFLAHIEADGKSDATLGAYRSDLAIAQRVLGAETAIDSIRPADVQRFNESGEVLLSRTGQPKAEPTYQRTRRVLRLALDYAEAEGWIVTTPCVEPD